MKALFLFLISFNVFAVVDLGAVNNSGTKHRQITNFDISGKPGSDPSTYMVKILVKEYSKYSDGSINVLGHKKYSFKVGEMIVDSEGNPIAENVAIMEGMINLFQNAYLAQDANPSSGRQ
jgi:hypothetical protein